MRWCAFSKIAMHARAQASNRMANASHGPRVKKTRENPKDNPKEPKVPKVRTRATHRKLVSQVLKTRNERQIWELRNLQRHVPLTASSNDGWNGYEWNDGWSFEWNDDWSSVGWHEGKEQTYDIPEAHFRCEVWMSVP